MNDSTKDGHPGLLDDGFVTVAQAATYLSVSRATVYVLMDAGELAYAKFGRSRRIPRRALLDYAGRSLVKSR